MPRKRSAIGTTHVYESILNESLFLRDNQTDTRNDCGVVAASVVTGMSYEFCRSGLLDYGYDPERGIFLSTMTKFLRRHKFTSVSVSASLFIGLRYPASKQGKRFVTPRQVARFPKAWAGLPPLLLWATSHVSAVKDGRCHDHAWGASSSLHVPSISIILPPHWSGKKDAESLLALGGGSQG